MIDCSRFLTLVDAYLDQELSEDQLQEFRHALDQCPELSRQVEQYTSLREALRAHPRETTPDDFMTRFRQRKAAAENEAGVHEPAAGNLLSWVLAPRRLALFVVSMAVTFVIGITITQNTIPGSHEPLADAVAPAPTDTTIQADTLFTPDFDQQMIPVSMEGRNQ